MKTKKINNGILFVLFSFLVILIIGVFAYALYKTLSFDTTIYNIEKGSFTYDKDYNYVLLKNDAKMKQKWDKNYYLKEKDTTINLGNDVVIYNKNDFKINIYGNNYQIKTNGDVQYSNKVVSVSKSGTPTFFKLSDRKYLMTGNSIKSDVKGIKTKDYLIIDIDKSGNALLLNHELNIKVLSTIKLETKTYTFDVANERIYVGDEIIDLKKINGSTNNYKEEEPEEKDSKDDKTTNNNDKTTNNNDNTTNTNQNTNTSNSTKISNITKDKINITKSLAMTSVTPYTSYIDVSYMINDPANEYTNVYLTLEKVGEESEKTKIMISKNKTQYRIRDLTPNTEYKISLCYSEVSKKNADLIEEKIESSTTAKTKKISTRIVINKVSNNKVYYTVYYDTSYAFDSAIVTLYSDGNILGRQNIETANATSSKGFSGSISASDSLGYEIILKIEDCIYQGETKNINIQTKFINR